jgi:hypothetical protein
LPICQAPQNSTTTRSAALAAVVLLGFLCQPVLARGAEPQLDLVECSSIDPAVTTELLAIELDTLQIVVSPAMHWTVRCHGRHATVQLHGTPGSRQATGEPARAKADAGTVSTEVDLSSTDEAAWPRLIAISASELVEQRKRRTSVNGPPIPSQAQETLVRVQWVALDVKTKARYLPSVGLSLGRAGDPGTNLVGLSLGVDRLLGALGLLALDLRGQWGKTNLHDVRVSWQLMSLAAAGGATLDLGLVDFDAMGGLRLGRIALAGEATTPDLSGRRLVGTTAGPFVALRLRRSVGKRLFFGAAVEQGYCLIPVRGNYDGGPRLLTVDGAWTNATFSVGWKL